MRGAPGTTSPPRSAPPPAAWLVPLALALACGIAWRGALFSFFSQDDFAYLGRAAGLYPRLDRPWRWLSAQGYFDLMRPLAGLHPLPYHATGLALHVAAALLLGALLSRRLPPAAAWLGAAFFAFHPAAYTVVHWISCTGDALAFVLALLTLAVSRRADRARWLALPLFALAVFAKESALPLPLAMAALPPAAGTGHPAPRRDPLWWTLLAFAAVAGILFALDDAARSGAGGARPYALSAGAHVARNALTYAGWAANAWLPTMRSFSDAPDAGAWVWGGAAILLWAAGCLLAPLRERGWVAGGIWFAAFVLPYLPLERHTYHYYLYLPLAGGAALVAIAADAWLPRGRAAGAIALLLGALLAVNGAFVIRKIETQPMPIAGLLADPVLDRARIAERVCGAVGEALPGRPVRLAVRVLAGPGAPAGVAEYARQNLRSALYDGLALRVMFARVDSVSFPPGPEPLDDTWRWVLARPDGASRVLAPAALDSLVARHGAPQ